MVEPGKNGLPPIPGSEENRTPGQLPIQNEPSVQEGPGLPPQMPSEEAGPAGLKKTISGAVGSVWIYFGLQIVAAILVTSFVSLVLFSLFGYDAYFNFPGWAEAFVLLITTVISGVLTFLFARKRLGLEQTPRAWKNTNFKASDVFYGICSCWTLSLLFGLVVILFETIASFFGGGVSQPDLNLNAGLAQNLINLVTTVILAPLLEELIFRGCILESLKKYSTSFAIVFSSLLFAMLHMNLAQSIPVFGMGLVFGWMYVRTGSLPMTIVLHLINNAVSMFSTLLPYPLAFMVEILLIVLAVVGLVFMVREKRNIRTIVFEKYQTGICWKMTSQSIGFWIFVIVAALACLLPVFSYTAYQLLMFN